MINEEQIEYEQFLSDTSCVVLRHLAYDERCEFVTTQCADEGELINYVHYVYCTLRPSDVLTEILCIIHIMTWCAVLFMITTIAADEFFCPPLKVLSTLLHMSEHLAGVTLLAFGNGSADLFTTIVSINDTDRLFYNDTAGGVLFVVGIVAGTVCIVSPFKIIPSSFLKDACFLLLGSLYIDIALGDIGIISRWNCILIFSFYFIYIAIIVLDQVLVTRELSKMQDPSHLKKYTAEDFKEIDLLKSQAQMELTVIKNNQRSTLNPQLTRGSKRHYMTSRNKCLRLLIALMKSVNPIDIKEWSSSSIYVRTWICLKSPFMLLLKIFVPICDYELDGHGWCKPLNCIQIVLLPLLVTLFLYPEDTYYEVPICFLTMAMTLPIAIYLWCTSRTFSPPKCHWILALYGCFGSIFIIYVCSTEVMEVLNVIGKTTGCNDAFLGCTLLAIGNNIGDFVANISLAKQGYQRMAFSACFGGPLFNAHISFGIILIVNTFNSEDGYVHIPLGPLRDNISVFLTLIIIAAIFILISTDFYARKTVGYFLIVVWSLFLLYTAFAEAEKIQTWDTEKS